MCNARRVMIIKNGISGENIDWFKGWFVAHLLVTKTVDSDSLDRLSGNGWCVTLTEEEVEYMSKVIHIKISAFLLIYPNTSHSIGKDRSSPVVVLSGLCGSDSRNTPVGF